MYRDDELTAGISTQQFTWLNVSDSFWKGKTIPFLGAGSAAPTIPFELLTAISIPIIVHKISCIQKSMISMVYEPNTNTSRCYGIHEKSKGINLLFHVVRRLSSFSCLHFPQRQLILNHRQLNKKIDDKIQTRESSNSSIDGNLGTFLALHCIGHCQSSEKYFFEILQLLQTAGISKISKYMWDPNT